MTRFAFILIMLLSVLESAHAQKIRNASGTALSRLGEDMSMEELKEKLRHEAIINAIENEFGTYVTQESFVDVDDGNTHFRIFGQTTIRGEWLKTIKEKFRESVKKVKENGKVKHELWLALQIEGKVRELTRPDIDFDFFTTNCRREACKTTLFENGDPMYLFFNTPADGFLSVYAVEGDEAFRLLPYQDMTGNYHNAVPVKADRDYVFFSNDEKDDYFNDFSRYLVDELVMFTDKEEEYLKLIVVFSTEEYTKPILKGISEDPEISYLVPRSLPAETLKAWLEDNRINNMNFYYRQLTVRIVK